MEIVKSLNGLTISAAQEGLAKCCAARGWVSEMLSRRPFASDDDLLAAAKEVWWSLSPESWVEAFAAHPSIGDLKTLREKFANTQKWAAHEQAGVQAASEETLQCLAVENRKYLDKFGYQFIICATGKTADEILAALERRLANNAAIELPIAAAEQLNITRLRLQKLFS